MDLHFQGLKDSYFAGMEQYEERQTAYSDNQFRELRNLIQSTAEAQNALFCSEFQKLSVLIREIRTLSFLLITLTILILHLNLSLEDFRPRISYLRLIVITASDICASYQPCQHNLQAIFITAVTFDVEFVIIKKGEIESVHVKRNTLESSPYMLVLMRTTCANKSLKIINKSTCLSLPIGTLLRLD
ncbi:hypothetical protein Lal_00032050 [Lupinus albus]|nr:hypothetical protein Lal_00032050 [Lupinus albus]